jgi:anti-sigma B factor antagonist
MPVNIRVDDDVVIVSNFGRLMNDPRHFDAGRDVGEMLDRGYKAFILELRGLGGVGDSGLGLLLTITRMIRQQGGEVVLAAPGHGVRHTIEEMKLDDYWELFDSVDEAKASFQ